MDINLPSCDCMTVITLLAWTYAYVVKMFNTNSSSKIMNAQYVNTVWTRYYF